MIEKVNADTACFKRLYKQKIGQKSKLGHVFKHNVYNAIYDLQKCPFTPEINEPSKKRNNVFGNAERLYSDGQKWIDNRKKRKKEEESEMFTPKTTQYHFRDLWERPKKNQRLGIDVTSRKTKYYDEEKFSPYRFKKAYIKGEFDDFFDNGEDGFQAIEKKNIVLHELPREEINISVLNKKESKEKKLSEMETTLKMDKGVSDAMLETQLKELEDLKNRRGKTTSRGKSKANSRNKSRVSSRNKSRISPSSKSGLTSTSRTPRGEKKSKKIGNKKKKSGKTTKRKGKKESGKSTNRGLEVSFDRGSVEFYKKEPELLYVSKEKKNHVNCLNRNGNEVYFIDIVKYYAEEKKGIEVNKSKSPKKKKKKKGNNLKKKRVNKGIGRRLDLIYK